ncbi:MAG: putative Ig domain-containing protein [Bacteroidota bacterium]
MKKINLIFICLAFVKIGISQKVPTDSLYMGQTKPGNEPKEFKLDITPGSFASERIAISNDGSEIYYSEIKSYYPVVGDKVKCYKYVNNKWTGAFELFDGIGVMLSVTNDTMFFEHNNKMYYSVREKEGWGKPSAIFSSIDTVHYLLRTNKGNYYASARSKSSVGLSDWSRIQIKGKDTTAISLGFPINSIDDDMDFYIAKDESYMITCPLGSIGISYPDKTGKWSNTRPFSDKINFGIGAWGAYVTADQKYLFFTTGTKMDYSDTHVYWVRIGNMIDSLKNTNLPPYLKNYPKQTSAKVGKEFTYTIPNDVVFDDDGEIITFEALLISSKPLPAWLSFNPKTRTLTGTPIAAANVVLRINAYDDKKEMTAFRFVINVTD